VFSPADYELTARITGLPVPRTVAERAAAAPIVARVLREFGRGMAPSPGFEDPSVRTLGATRSLNAPPSTAQPELKAQLEQRMRAGVTDSEDMAQAQAIAEVLLENPQLVEMLLDMLLGDQMESEASGDYLSQQAPIEYDIPNYGGQYSVLNAPSNSQIPPSVSFQQLS